jgi:hypothetical protein
MARGCPWTPILLRPVGGQLCNSLTAVLGVAADWPPRPPVAVFYPLGHPTPYASDFDPDKLRAKCVKNRFKNFESIQGLANPQRAAIWA